MSTVTILLREEDGWEDRMVTPLRAFRSPVWALNAATNLNEMAVSEHHQLEHNSRITYLVATVPLED